MAASAARAFNQFFVNENASKQTVAAGDASDFTDVNYFRTQVNVFLILLILVIKL